MIFLAEALVINIIQSSKYLVHICLASWKNLGHICKDLSNSWLYPCNSHMNIICPRHKYWDMTKQWETFMHLTPFSYLFQLTSFRGKNLTDLQNKAISNANNTTYTITIYRQEYITTNPSCDWVDVEVFSL